MPPAPPPPPPPIAFFFSPRIPRRKPPDSRDPETFSALFYLPLTLVLAVASFGFPPRDFALIWQLSWSGQFLLNSYKHEGESPCLLFETFFSWKGSSPPPTFPPFFYPLNLTRVRKLQPFYPFFERSKLKPLELFLFLLIGDDVLFSFISVSPPPLHAPNSVSIQSPDFLEKFFFNKSPRYPRPLPFSLPCESSLRSVLWRTNFSVAAAGLLPRSILVFFFFSRLSL